MIALSDRMADCRRDDEWYLVRLSLAARCVDVLLPAVRDPIAQAIIGALLASPDAPAVDLLAAAAAGAGVHLDDVEKAVQSHLVDLPIVGDADAELRRLADRMRADDERDAAERRLALAIERGQRGEGLAELADAAGTLEAIRSGGGQGRRCVTLADVLAEGIHATPQVLRTGLAWWDGAQPEGGMGAATMTVIAGAPGVGKTALCLQLTIAALSRDPELRAVWALGEMTPSRLALRAVQCLSGVGVGILRRAPADRSPQQAQRVQQAEALLVDIAPRLSLVEAPLSPRAIAKEVDERRAGLVVVDYLQLCRPDAGAACDSRRAEVDAVLFALRAMVTRSGVAAIVVANMSKSTGARLDALNFAKESSEIGYACDAAYVGEIPPGDQHETSDDVGVRWSCVKQRHGEPRSVETIFARSVQQYRSAVQGVPR